jgi:hypothetical protein
LVIARSPQLPITQLPITSSFARKQKTRQTNNCGLAGLCRFPYALKLRQPKTPDLWSGDGGQRG